MRRIMWGVQGLALAMVWAVVGGNVGCGDHSGGGGNGIGQACDQDHVCPDPLVCGPDGTCIRPSEAGIEDAGPGRDGGDGTVSDAGDGGGLDGGDAGCTQGHEACGNTCCDQGQTCYQDHCILEQPPCQTDQECQEDSYCQDGQCIPYGLGPRGPQNPDCTRVSIAGLFQPSLQCAWTGPPAGDPYPNHIQMLSTPMVMDFDFDNNPATLEPSIVIMTYDGLDGDSGYYQGHYGVVRILDGATCQQLYEFGTLLNGCNPPAIGDLDGDGRPDVVVHGGAAGEIQAFTYDSANDIWVQMFVGHDGANSTVYPGATGWAAPAIDDLDDDGFPEILSGGLVYDHQGLLLDASLGLYVTRYPVAADLDGDGLVDLATGEGVYSFDPNAKHWSAQWSGGPYAGYVAVADFGTYGDDPSKDDRLTKDGIAEIAVIRAGTALVMNVHGRVVFGPITLPGSASAGGGPPTVGDFDGDGLVELAAAGSDSYTVFDPDCQGLSTFNRCHSLRSDGILWSRDSQDYSSNVTGSSLFDFEGDGRVEAIYADESFARVYDGRTGEVVFSAWTSSCTWNENPIVADVDGDYNAELLVPSNQNCGTVPRTDKHWSFNPSLPFYETSHRGNPMDPLFRGLRCKDGADCISGICSAGYCRCTTDDDCGGAGSGFVCDPPPRPPMSPTPGTGNTCRAEWLGPVNGVRVYHDVLDRWVDSRPVWNQHTYAVTNVNDDGTIPKTSQWKQNWTQPGLNNFRQNVQGSANVNSSPDLTDGGGVLTECNTEGKAVLTVHVCNRGTEPVASGVPVTFYEGDASSGQVICTETTAQVLPPGSCQDVSCLWSDPPGPNAPETVTVVVDDDGTGSGQTTECVEGNNSASIAGVYCNVVG